MLLECLVNNLPNKSCGFYNWNNTNNDICESFNLPWTLFSDMHLTLPYHDWFLWVDRKKRFFKKVSKKPQRFCYWSSGTLDYSQITGNKAGLFTNPVLPMGVFFWSNLRVRKISPSAATQNFHRLSSQWSHGAGPHFIKVMQMQIGLEEGNEIGESKNRMEGWSKDTLTGGTVENHCVTTAYPV